MAPGTVTAVCACVEGGGGGTVGLQPVMVPASDEKRKRAAPELVPECTTNAVGEPLKTAPVGAPSGIETVSGTFATAVVPTAPEYRVDTSVPLSATHAGVVGPNASPHALTRLGSASSAEPGTSETRSRCAYRPRSRLLRSPARAGDASVSPTVAARASALHHLQDRPRCRRAHDDERMGTPIGQSAGGIRPLAGIYAAHTRPVHPGGRLA